MASISKHHLQMLARAAKQRLPRVPFNAGWQHVYRLWQIGETDGAQKQLYLSVNDHQLLRQMAQIDTGLDILALDFDVTRQQMSQQSANEKYANIAPEADYLLLKLAPPLCQGLLAEHDCALRLKVDRAVNLCEQLAINCIMVVENLGSFDNVFQYQFDQSMTKLMERCMVVYRGSHHYSPAGCKHFLGLIDPTKVQVIAFTDLDPAGLMIAHSLDHCQHLVVPQLALSAPATLLALPQINSATDFYKQQRQLAYINETIAAKNNPGEYLGLQPSPLVNRLMPSSSTSDVIDGSKGLAVDWDQLVAWVARYHVSIKQQHMLAKKLILSLLRF